MPSKELECRDAEIGYRVHALDHCAPFRSAQLPSFRAKIIFDLQLADLPVQNIDLGFVDGSLRRSPVLEDAGHTVEQLLLPVVDMVWMDPKNSLANSAKVRSPLIAASATFALHAALCFFRIRFISCSRATGVF
jgi:hypothetical protein